MPWPPRTVRVKGRDDGAVDGGGRDLQVVLYGHQHPVIPVL